jgi:para-nitrobenzyl esterase
MTEPFPIARAPAGTYRGHRVSGVLRFDGIPYAAPPTGELRFRWPDRLPPGPGTIDARRSRPGPLQRPGPALGTRPVDATDEACLHLNVVTPDLAGVRPVMVWIHGGGFTNGQAADPLHAGTRLVARGDVVLVTLDYRLGVFGWLHDLDDAEGANVGLADQLLALRWVRENVSAFGGDPTRVTLFGESAGAMSILALMACPDADALFARVILQSGALGGLQSAARAREVRTRFAAAVGSDEPERWRALDAATLLDAQLTVGEAVRGDTGRGAWRPVLDGRLVTAGALDAQARPVNRARAVLIGTNRDEQRLFLNLRERLGEMDARRRLARVLAVHLETGEDAEDAAAALLSAYGDLVPDLALPYRYSAVLTDLYYRLPALRIVQRRIEAGGESWLYRFDHPSPALRGRLGACHALEIPFVFGTLDAPGMARFAGEDAETRQLSGHMMDAWSTFARDGNCGDGWPPWARDTRRTWIAATPDRCVAGVDDAILAAWSAVLPAAALPR